MCCTVHVRVVHVVHMYMMQPCKSVEKPIIQYLLMIVMNDLHSLTVHTCCIILSMAKNTQGISAPLHG
jgi:hypothetical protein